MCDWQTSGLLCLLKASINGRYTLAYGNNCDHWFAYEITAVRAIIMQIEKARTHFV